MDRQDRQDRQYSIEGGIRVALPRTSYRLVMVATNDKEVMAESHDFAALEELRLQLKALGYAFNHLTAVKEP